MKGRLELFDAWASSYDPAEDPEDFPFAGYDAVLNGIIAFAEPKEATKVLELGVGTGNLAAKFGAVGCEVWGLDFSKEMLARAKKQLPAARLLQADLLADLPAELPQDFAVITSAYVFHEFPLAEKVAILRRSLPYVAKGGFFVIGDIAFETKQAREKARQQYQEVWDDDEHYWAADEAVATLDKAGFTARYVQVSSCAGIFVITR